jgi:hypothetical protein
MTRGVTHVSYTIRAESGGNATIVNRKGDVCAVVEDWVLFVDGKRIGDVDNYRDALVRTEHTLEQRA